ncbi:hypothetical protein VTJ49DRAFT_6261 [Mycothermus thermophilus]|uniref:Uncharacterized protein n=1 Tax=Humicola insolens TaxID=85995 RepID=A0ABR3V1Q0_HUMIN
MASTPTMIATHQASAPVNSLTTKRHLKPSKMITTLPLVMDDMVPVNPDGGTIRDGIIFPDNGLDLAPKTGKKDDPVDGDGDESDSDNDSDDED